MLASSVPVRFQQPFANNAGVGYVRAIPNTTADTTAASLNLGFPPACFVDVTLGGTPPNGMDFNGILNEITANSQWVQAGGFAAYDSAFSTAIGGYPNNAVLQMATGKGFWKSAADNNTTNPDASGANWVVAAIAPGAYLDLSVAGAADVTLTSVQAANRVIDLFGALTGNINVIVPTATGNWIFNNGTTGAFTITIKTATGTGFILPRGTSVEAWSDGVNVYAANGVLSGQTLQKLIYTDAGSSTASLTLANITGSVKTITPKSTNSTIFIRCSFEAFIAAVGGANTASNYQLYEGTVATPLGTPYSNGVSSGAGAGLALNAMGTVSYPVSNSALTTRTFGLGALTSNASASAFGTVLVFEIEEIQN